MVVLFKMLKQLYRVNGFLVLNKRGYLISLGLVLSLSAFGILNEEDSRVPDAFVARNSSAIDMWRLNLDVLQ